MSDYGLVPSYELPQEFRRVWDDISSTDFKPETAEAVVIFPGLLDPDVIVSYQTRWFDVFRSFDHRFVAGIHTPQGQEAMRGIERKQLGLATWQVEAIMTPHQTVWTMAQLIAGGLKSVALYAPQFHLPRATMTLVKAALDAGWEGTIYPYGWRQEGDNKLALAGFDNQAMHDDLIPGEQTRWVNYTTKGDIAAPETWARFRPALPYRSVSQMFAAAHYGGE